MGIEPTTERSTVLPPDLKSYLGVTIVSVIPQTSHNINDVIFFLTIISDLSWNFGHRSGTVLSIIMLCVSLFKLIIFNSTTFLFPCI